MKWFFFVLLLANIGLFVWIYPQTTPSGPETNHMPGVKTLILLKEAGQSELNLRRQAASDQVGEAQPAGNSGHIEPPAEDTASAITQVSVQDLANDAIERGLLSSDPKDDGQAIDAEVYPLVAASQQEQEEPVATQPEPGKRAEEWVRWASEMRRKGFP